MTITKHGKYWVLGDTEKRKHTCPECQSNNIEWDILRSSSPNGGNEHYELNSVCKDCGCEWTIERVVVDD